MTNETDYIIVEKYHFIARQLTIYGGIILFIFCLFGTSMNIITFSQQTYHLSTFSHLTPGSISNILQYGFYYDWTINSITYCKMKNYFVYVFTIISGTLAVFASIDRFLLSSGSARRWHYSSRLIARRCIISVISFCFFVRVVYTCLFDGFIPPLIMMIFGLKTYNNMRQLRRRSKVKSLSTRRINQQLTSMLILQSIKSSFASFPYSAFNTYWLITFKNEKSLMDEAKENLAMQIVYLLFWSNYTSFLSIFIHRIYSEISGSKQ